MANGIQWREVSGRRVAYAVLSKGSGKNRKREWVKLPERIKTQRAAETARREIVDNRRASELRLSRNECGLRWSDYAARIVAEAEAGNTATTAANYETRLTRFGGFIGDADPADLDAETIHAYITHRRTEGASPTLIKMELRLAKQVCRRAGCLAIWEGVRMPSEPPARVSWMTPEQFAALEEVAPEHRRFRYQVLVYTGARRGEAEALTWGDVDLKGGAIRIRNAQKGRGTRVEYRTVPICSQLREALEGRTDDPGEKVLADGGCNWRRDLLNDCHYAKIDGGYRESVKAVKKGEKGAVVVGTCWRIHDMRHTFASWLAQSGKVTLHELRDLLGHSSVNVTERYAHLIPGRHDAAAEALGAIRPKPMAKVEMVAQ